MNANFARSLASVLRHEGGYVNHPNDPGGPTNRGITLATFRKWVKKDGSANDLKRITDEQVAKIYRSVYWNGIKGDDLPGGIDYAVLDFAVNSGPTRAAKALQAVLGVEQDGAIGPVTLAAARAADPIKVVKALCDQRMAFLRKLSNWPTFGKGWTSRVEDVRFDAIQLTTAAKPTGPVILPTTPNPPPPDIPSPDPRQPEKKGGLGWLWIVGAAIAAVLAFVAFVP
jgi:lysozyme family protein